MNTKLLRQNILTLAISGRLVPQDAAEGSAADLLTLIAAERTNKLQAEANRRAEQKAERTGKKVEPEKVQPVVITPLPAEDAPFAIPDSWRWVRLEDIGTIVTGSTPSKSVEEFYSSEDYPFYKPADLDQGINTINSTECVSEKGFLVSRKLPVDSVLVTCIGTIGKTGLIKREGICNQQINAIITDIVNPYFVYYMVLSPFMQEKIIRSASATTLPVLNKNKFSAIKFPLPPLSEQKRIVAAIERWFAQADAVEQSGAELKKLSVLAMRRVLSLAISGKLVPQDAAEGSAADLLTLIAAERTNKLQAEANRRAEQKAERTGKKVEPEKVQPIVITPLPAEEAPFAIPESWRWVKVEDVFEVNPKNDIDDELTVGFVPMECVSAGYSGSHTFVERKWDEIKKGYTHFKDGDYAVAKISPCFENLKSVIFKDLPNGYGAGTTELVVLRPYIKQTNYFLWLFKSKWYIDQGCVYFKGNVGQQRVGKSIFTTLYIPLPPLSEQYRIVEKIEAAEMFLRQVAEGV